jgi:starch synthase (maltosyl-transferring)
MADTSATQTKARTKKPAKAETELPPVSRESAALMDRLAPYRFLIEKVTPEINGGRYPIKREVGDEVAVAADIVCEGHGKVAASIMFRAEDQGTWHEVPMRHVDNDRWAGSFTVERNTRYRYTVAAWSDSFATLRSDMEKKLNAGQSIEVDLIEMRALIELAHDKSSGPDRKALTGLLEQFDEARMDAAAKLELLMGRPAEALMRRCAMRPGLTHYEPELEIYVDRVGARFASWYEMFWRSQGTDPNRSATIDDCIARLDYVKEMGFDVVYLVPHHPIGKTNRKGKNNTLTPAPDDPGSPYAIGSEEGGHMAVNPDWGTLEDFRRFVAETNRRGMEVAIDFAIQCSPDHPWIKDHPDWFKWRPDGSIRFAENPPKKYEDIVNVEFYEIDGTTHKRDLWIELRNVVEFWIEQGVKIFRVDNPHTKPFPFWEWMIRDIQSRHPEALFLSEAFTRPKIMKGLAKLGFTQSYSYFTWRTSKWEMTEYLQELTQGEAKEYMRANFFTNTPDILPFHLQEGGRPAFMVRAVLATTLNSLWGMYNGFELCENTPVPGKEEYLNSEKYQYMVWDWDRPGNIRSWITKLNHMRRENPALQEYDNLKFYNIFNDSMLLYGKITKDRSNFVLVVVNLDFNNAQEGTFELPLWELNLPDFATVKMEDLFSGVTFTWTGKDQRVWLGTQHPAFVWRVTPA